MRRYIYSVLVILILLLFINSCSDSDYPDQLDQISGLRTVQIDAGEGGCEYGGIKIEIVEFGIVDESQTEYVCNESEEQNLKDCDGLFVDLTSDSANCGICGNVCNVGFECDESLCKPMVDLSRTIITCNAQTITAYNDEANCGGCGKVCAPQYACHASVCVMPHVGDIITFGSYEQDNNINNGKEAIAWRVLDTNGSDQVLVISEKVLDKKQYYPTKTDITWEKSTIRSWLNGYAASYNSYGTDYTSDNFIDNAFTAEEQARIVKTTVPAHANPDYSTLPGNDTTDKIFLLSIVEAKQYFTSDSDRRADATRYAVKQGVYVTGSESGMSTSDGTCKDLHCYADWWLRSPGYSSYYAAGVLTAGSINGSGYYAIYTDYGVRPALWLKY